MKKMILCMWLLLAFCVSAHAVQFQTNYVRTDYSITPVTTAAFVTIVASMPSDANSINLADTSGQSFVLARFLSDCATLISSAYVPPGGLGQAPLFIQKGNCVGLKALSGNATSGENGTTFFY